MTEAHLQALLVAAAVPAGEGLRELPEGRTLTLHIAANGASLNVGKVNAVRLEDGLLEARTTRGEQFFLALADIFAGAIDGGPQEPRKAGFR